MQDYIKPLVKEFKKNANPENAEPMAKYMKNLFPYLGIKTPERREISKKFFKEYGLPKTSDFEEIIRDLWELPEREFQYFAVGMMIKFKDKVDKNIIDFYEYLITTKSWWDSVDGIASWLVGSLFQRFPEMIETYIPKWLKSENMWLQRTVILFQLNYKEKTDVMLLGKSIMIVANSKEFFIRKAIGWALREYSKTDAQAVINFVGNNELAPLSKREALKWLKNQGKI